MIDLFRCLKCNEVISRLGPPYQDLAVESGSDDMNLEWESHRTHPLEPLARIPGTTVSRDPYDHPRRTVYFMASNGEEDFLISKHRNGSSYGYLYNLKKGVIQNLPTLVTAREGELLEQIRWEANGNGPVEEEIDHFLSIVRDRLQKLGEDDLTGEVADLYEPRVSYCIPPPAFYQEIIDSCLDRLPAPAARWFADFVKRHQGSHLPLGVRLTRDFEILEEVALGKKLA